MYALAPLMTNFAHIKRYDVYKRYVGSGNVESAAYVSIEILGMLISWQRE